MMKLVHVILSLFLILFLNTAHSKDNVYLIGGLGNSNYSIGDSDITEINNKLTGLGFATATTTVSTDNLSYEFGFGINVFESYYIEATYLNFGNIEISSTTTSPAESLTADIAIKGFNVDLSKSIGPFGLSAGIIKIDNDVEISSSLGNADVPIDDYFLPKFGVSVQLSNYRAEISRTFLTTNSYLNNLMLSYIINLL